MLLIMLFELLLNYVTFRDGHFFVNRITNIWNSLPGYCHFTSGCVF